MTNSNFRLLIGRNTKWKGEFVGNRFKTVLMFPANLGCNHKLGYGTLGAAIFSIFRGGCDEV